MSRDPRDLAQLSRLVSRVLRHAPWEYELEPDAAGWVRLDQLLAAIRGRGGLWSDVSRELVEAMIDGADKRRHELRGDKIRALYGHSLPGRIAKELAAPPEVLYHGTRPELVPSILASGLLPMGRQYVHLSVDGDTASAVGRRKCARPAVLRVRAGEAWLEGVSFYRGNERVWLADAVPARFVAGS